MVIFDPGERNQGEAFEFTRSSLETLLADFERIWAGRSPEFLAGDAPLLDNWTLSQRPAPCLVGLSTGHPILAGRARPITTSDLWMLSRDHQWARTASRWYRLGRRAGSHRDVS